MQRSALHPEGRALASGKKSSARQRQPGPLAAHAAAGPDRLELRVCNSKSCRRQGAAQIAQFCRDLALPQLEVAECGCLSNCGGGPNMVLLRHGASNGGDGAPLAQLAHMSTPARVAQGLQAFAGLQLGEAEVKVTELRLAGNAAARSGALGEAVALYSQALDLQPAHGRHLLLANRSGARLAMGDAEGALQDARTAADCGPPGFTIACVREVEALLALGKQTIAMQVLLVAVECNPAFAQSAEYHMLVEHINKSLQQQPAGVGP